MNKITLFLFDIASKKHTLHFLNEFEKLIKFSRESIEEYQIQKLKKLLKHAEENVPFYRKRFIENNFFANDFTHLDQLKKIPPLTRQDLQGNWQEIIAVNYRKNNLSKGSSSGSTGLPVVYYKDKYAISAGQAANYIGWSLSGWKMNMKGLHIWGNPSTVNNEWEKKSSKLKALLFGHHKFPAYKLTNGQKFRELFDLINNNNYDFIDGYTNAIYLFANFLQKNNLKFKRKIKYVLTTAENLQDFQRKSIEKNIAPVYDTYGCSEINGIAYECSHCKLYHIIEPHVHVEFGDIVDEVDSRELIITDLNNYAFPLIRYKNDDLGIPSGDNTCECHIPFARIKSISGRQSDMIKFKDGGTLSVPSFFGSMLLKQIKGLKQYQIEKVEDNLLHINFVTSSEFAKDDFKNINNALNQYLGNRIQYKINFLDKIEYSNNGKFKLFVDRTK